MDKLWLIHAMKYYPLVKMSELHLFLSTWIHLKYIILSKKKTNCQRIDAHSIMQLCRVLKQCNIYCLLLCVYLVRVHKGIRIYMEIRHINFRNSG